MLQLVSSCQQHILLTVGCI